MKKALVLLLAFAAVTAGGVALALPATSPDSTLGTNGKVRALLELNGVMWVAGQFTATSDGQGGLSNIVGIDVTTGQRALTVTNPQLTGSSSIVYDLATDGTNVYAAGTFNAANGSNNLVAFNGSTGALTVKFNRPPALKSVLYDSVNSRVLGGAAKLKAWLPTGPKDPSWDTTTLHTDSTLRAHITLPSYRDVKADPAGGFFAACQCDSLTDGATTYPTKAMVRLNANGSYDPTWVPGGTDPLSADSSAFGIDLYIDTNPAGVVLAAGGSDFAEKFDMTSGQKIWKNDTNGSSQAVTRYNDTLGSNYFVGGHYRCLTKAGTGGTQDFFHPRLSALSLTGVLDDTWTVPITPIYNGVWVVTQDSLGNLWVGGEFKKVGGTWTGDSTNNCTNKNPTAMNQTSQTYVARFAAPPIV